MSMEIKEIDSRFGYYECSKCGFITQETKMEQVLFVNEETQEETLGEMEVFDGEASIAIVIEHEKTHTK
jgi:hypothetical protein